MLLEGYAGVDNISRVRTLIEIIKNTKPKTENLQAPYQCAFSKSL